MIWFLLFVFLFALLMGFFQMPIWIMYVVLVAVIVLMLFRNPLLFGKDVEKMMAYLKKSKSPNVHFLFHFLQGDLSAAEEAVKKIRSPKLMLNAGMMLFIERKQYGKAKEMLAQMGDNKVKWYSLSDIAIKEGDIEVLAKYKGKIKDVFLLQMLEVDQEVHDGKRQEAVALLDNMIPKLRGHKLLTAFHYKKQILEGRV